MSRPDKSIGQASRENRSFVQSMTVRERGILLVLGHGEKRRPRCDASGGVRIVDGRMGVGAVRIERERGRQADRELDLRAVGRGVARIDLHRKCALEIHLLLYLSPIVVIEVGVDRDSAVGELGFLAKLVAPYFVGSIVIGL